MRSSFSSFSSPFVLFLFYKLLDRIKLFDGGPASQQNKAKYMKNLSDHQLLLKTQTVPEGKIVLNIIFLLPHLVVEFLVLFSKFIQFLFLRCSSQNLQDLVFVVICRQETREKRLG